MSEGLSLASAFNVYQMNLAKIVRYLEAMTPHIVTDRGNLDLFVKGTAVIVIADYEGFLQGLLTSVVATRTDVVREHFASGSPKEKQLAANASRKTLASLAHARVSFKKFGASIERTFQAFSAVPRGPTNRHASRSLNSP